MNLTLNDGFLAQNPQEGEELKNAGYSKCYNPACNFFISPEAQSQALEHPDAGYVTCPNHGCYQSHDLMHDMPWHGADQEYGEWAAGGGTRIGLTMAQQAEIGENLIEGLRSLPGYGPITSWHQGGAVAASPLDGTTSEWGIEVKTIGMDAIHHRFIPGRASEKKAKNQEVERLGLQGVLGILVMLNYKTSMADIYVKEMPLAPWQNRSGRTITGVSTFRTNTAERLLERVPFKNPFMDPHDPVPHGQVSHEEEPIPF